MKIKLPSGIEIGDGCPAFIVAEVGSNWTTMGDCFHSIVQAKLCGADAVKFQLYDYASLYGPNPFHDHSKPIAGALPIAWLPYLKAECDRAGIEFMCSAFSPELIEAVDPYVNIHKVASAECTHKRMLETLRKYGKPVFLSTGAHGAEDIKQSLETLRTYPIGGVGVYAPPTWNYGLVDVVLFYCVAAYPANEIHLGGVSWLREHFGTLSGYSDHSTDALIIPNASTAYGACVIEKHVTFIDADTPDNGHSLSGDQFTKMVKQIRGGQEFKFGPTPAEKPMVIRHNRRLIAIKDIGPGDSLVDGFNFGIYRSLKDETHAFSPFMIDEVNGRIALKQIRAGDGIGPGDV